VTVPVGFGATVFAATDGLPTSLTVGPDGRVYATVMSADFSSGQVLAWDDLGGVAGPARVVASGLDQPLGIAFGGDGTLYVSENRQHRGRITGLRDTDGDGTFEQRHTVLKNLPNGRHQTNGLTIGPDGWIYIANGNATDDGVFCGPEPVESATCAQPEVKPWTGAILKAHPDWRDVDLLTDVVMTEAAYSDPEVIGYQEVLVAEGYRNIYGLAFSPDAPTQLYTVNNGADNPSSSETYHRTDVADMAQIGNDPATGLPRERPVIDDMGFPSCLYDPHFNTFPLPELGHAHPGNPTPEDNPRQEVIERFGRCRRNAITRPVGFPTEGHEGSSGVAFVPKGNFPARYTGDLLLAEWGSLWNLNGGSVTGHKIIQAEVLADGTIGAQREFMTTPLPMDVAFDADGVLFVADMAGAIYRVEHVVDTPGEVTVRMVQGQFVPQVLTVPRRTTVVWANEDMVAHNVRGQQAVVPRQPYLRPGTELDSPGDVPPGGTHRYTTGDLVGAWRYASTAASSGSPAMHGVLVVAPVDR
jgi:glucose/arabinose dehydrogenase